MVKQYPYTLQVLTLTGGGKDSDGNPIPAVEQYVDYAKCRDEANSSGKLINLVDGSAHAFDSLIQMPKGTEPVSVDTAIRVVDGTELRVTGEVKRFHKGQLHSRLWV